MKVVLFAFLSFFLFCSSSASFANNIELSSYDDKVRVNTVFGTGRQATTDSTGLIGEINNPIDAVFDSTENYLYLTDQQGGGLLRKLTVTSSAGTLYGVKTVFAG